MKKYDYLSGKHLKAFTIDTETFFSEDVSPVTAIFKEAAAQLGIDFDNCSGKFRCTEIVVAKDVCEKAIAMIEEAYGKQSAGVTWLMCGPKMQEDLPNGTIAVSDMFYDKGGEEE